ncbi:MAG: hypothetical protein AAF329_28935, partial [Cyanobacteria bacterium P01_A01_bin.17]
SFLDYLLYKTRQQTELSSSPSPFLTSVTGLGNSGQQDISMRDEEILKEEVDPVSGWNIRSDNQR